MYPLPKATIGRYVPYMGRHDILDRCLNNVMHNVRIKARSVPQWPALWIVSNLFMPIPFDCFPPNLPTFISHNSRRRKESPIYTDAGLFNIDWLWMKRVALPVSSLLVHIPIWTIWRNWQPPGEYTSRWRYVQSMNYVVGVHLVLTVARLWLI